MNDRKDSENKKGMKIFMKSELLAPAGSIEGMRAAIAAGADAVYMGGELFGARAYANNPEEEGLKEAIDYVHLHKKKLYLTVNTLLKNKELKPYWVNTSSNDLIKLILKNSATVKEKIEQLLRDEEIEPEAFEIIQKRTKSEKALRNVVKYSEYLKNKDNGKFVYADGYLTMLGMKNKKKIDLPYMCMYLIVFIIISVSMWSYDIENNMTKILYITSNGKRSIFRQKFIALFFSSIIGGCIYFLLQYFNVKENFTLYEINASAYCIPELENIPKEISIGMLIVICLTIRMFYVFVSGIVSGIIYKITGNKNGTIVIVLIIMIVPILIYDIG